MTEVVTIGVVVVTVENLLAGLVDDAGVDARNERLLFGLVLKANGVL